MTNIEPLVKVLCTDTEIEKDLKELRFGTYIEGYDFKGRCLFKTIGGCYAYKESLDCEDLITNSSFLSKKHFKIIGNEPEIRHILLYCSNDVRLECTNIGSNGDLRDGNDLITNIDNKLPLSQQPKETIDALVEYLLTIK